MDKSSQSDLYLKHLNKLSQKISKPIRTNPPLNHLHQQQQIQIQDHLQQQKQNQPPVYNINKSDFRDVVQKLTGSPSQFLSQPSPPIHPPKSQSSRLQRIRPPPLAHLSTRPPPPLPNNNPRGSPLPPFPSVHAAAESPISAYMRYLRSSPPMQTIVPSTTTAPLSQFYAPNSPLAFGRMGSPNSPFPLLSPTPRWKDV
ncbi:hypothetical protein GIB67_043005 [Kingdonia uniflora]|uniref:VQ domain-containing protein n=1 Tax=Kingdonia uniflora TaxID=39325 RepID=A0A7J7NSY6_9MAGN|nr:hypothetical protein GIB67_043005 [Kingdonia uniflora]